MRNDITDEYHTRVVKTAKPDYMSDFYATQAELLHDARMLGFNVLLNNKLKVTLSPQFTETVKYLETTEMGKKVWVKTGLLAG
jgi:hypothetical protein